MPPRNSSARSPRDEHGPARRESAVFSRENHSPNQPPKQETKNAPRRRIATYDIYCYAFPTSNGNMYGNINTTTFRMKILDLTAEVYFKQHKTPPVYIWYHTHKSRFTPSHRPTRLQQEILRSDCPSGAKTRCLSCFCQYLCDVHAWYLPGIASTTAAGLLRCC